MRMPSRRYLLIGPLISLAIGAGAALVLPSVIGGCSDSPQVNFGPPEGLKGAMLEQPGDGGGPPPPPPADSGPPPPPVEGGGGGDAGCPVSWTNTIYSFMATKYTCTASMCHGPGSLNTPVMTADAVGTYNALKAYTMTGADGLSHPYIVPGSTDPTKSTIECNLTPTPPKCGAIPMPNQQIMAPGDFQALDTWIRMCGAPLN